MMNMPMKKPAKKPVKTPMAPMPMRGQRTAKNKATKKNK